MKKLWNMKVTIIPIGIGALGTVTNGFLNGLEEWELVNKCRPSKQHYWEQPEYREETLRLKEPCCHSNSSERQSANADVKNTPGGNDNNYNNRLFVKVYDTKYSYLKQYIHNSMVYTIYFYTTILCTFTWFQIFRSNTINLNSILWCQVFLYYKIIYTQSYIFK